MLLFGKDRQNEDQLQVAKLRKGDPQAFSNLYITYYQKFLKFANSYAHDKEVAGNLVQDSFLALWENREKLTDDTYLPAYLLTLVKNNCLNHLTRLKTKLKAEENVQTHFIKSLELRCSTLEACDPQYLFSADVEAIIQSTLKTLPEKCRQAFMLSRFEGLTNKEISLRMKISLKGVEFHITKALKLLRENLKDYIISLVISFLLFW
jgi:RNA polymerase sigma-70 factor, ECF subfamily